MRQLDWSLAFVMFSWNHENIRKFYENISILPDKVIVIIFGLRSIIFKQGQNCTKEYFNVKYCQSQHSEHTFVFVNKVRCCGRRGMAWRLVSTYGCASQSYPNFEHSMTQYMWHFLKIINLRPQIMPITINFENNPQQTPAE